MTKYYGRTLWAHPGIETFLDTLADPSIKTLISGCKFIHFMNDPTTKECFVTIKEWALIEQIYKEYDLDLIMFEGFDFSQFIPTKNSPSIIKKLNFRNCDIIELVLSYVIGEGFDCALKSLTIHDCTGFITDDGVWGCGCKMFRKMMNNLMVKNYSLHEVCMIHKNYTSDEDLIKTQNAFIRRNRVLEEWIKRTMTTFKSLIRDKILRNDVFQSGIVNSIEKYLILGFVNNSYELGAAAYCNEIEEFIYKPDEIIPIHHCKDFKQILSMKPLCKLFQQLILTRTKTMVIDDCDFSTIKIEVLSINTGYSENMRGDFGASLSFWHPMSTPISVNTILLTNCNRVDMFIIAIMSIFMAKTKSKYSYRNTINIDYSSSRKYKININHTSKLITVDTVF